MPAPGNTIYSSEYKKKLYIKWYNLGKPTSGKFSLEIEPYNGKIPNQLTLQTWIKQWEIDCQDWDNRIEKELTEGIVHTKVEMFREQAEEARELRALAFNWLKENIDELTPSVAVRLWTEAMNIEQSIAGIPEAIEKMMNMGDEQLVEETLKLMEEANIESIDAISSKDT